MIRALVGCAGVVAIVLPLTLPVACGGSLGNAPRSRPQCQGSQTSCLTTPACTWDESRACETCKCTPPSAPPDYTPQGPPAM